MKRVIVGITGATGTIYGVRLMEVMQANPEIEIHLIMSRSAKLTLKMEHDLELDYINGLAHEVHDPGNIGASISSGSFHSSGMVIAPCSIKTMSNIAMGNTGDLISRAADVILKERRTLVVAIRETPLHLGHIENLDGWRASVRSSFRPFPRSTIARLPFRISSISPVCACSTSWTSTSNRHRAGVRRAGFLL